VDGNQVETANVKEKRKATLGEYLVAARERRGLSREIVVQQTHIPAHYVQMLEDDDYRRISDQLYLLPFLRKYSTFLDIDQDETAMRLLREVQRVDNSPSPVRLAEPRDDSRHYRERNWTKPILFSGLIAVIVGAYIAQSRYNESDTTTAPQLQSAQALVSPSSPASKGTVNSALAAQSARLSSVGELDSSAPQQRTYGTRAATRPDTLAVTQVVVTPRASPREPSMMPQRKMQGSRRVPNP